MWLIEWWRPGRDWPKRPLWLARAAVFNGAQVGVAILGTATWDRYLPELALWSVDTLGLWPGALCGYLVITFIYYWWHRARHEVPWLWRGLHQIHHSPQRLELLTSFYKHPLEIIVNGLLSSSILYLLVGTNAAQAGLAVLLTGVAELVYHWNVKTPYWMGFLIQRPESHCVHHERDRHSSNFSDLPLWDILFGTFHNPRVAEFDCGFAGDAELDVIPMLIGQQPARERPTHAN